MHLSKDVGRYRQPPSSSMTGGTPTNSLEQVCELWEGAEGWVRESGADLVESEPTEVGLDGAPAH